MWNNELMSNAKKCIECVDDMDDGDGTYNFKEICILYKKFPQVFFPLFDLQVHVINQTLGEYWWESHKAAMKFKKHEMEEKEFQSLRKKQQDAAKAMDLVNDDIIRARMGYVSFYLTPWNRKKERERIRRIAAIEGEIERGLHGIK